MADIKELLTKENLPQEGDFESAPKPEVEIVPEVREAAPEQPPEMTEAEKQEAARLQQQAEQIAPTRQPVIIPKDPIIVDVENLLAENLAEIYKNLPEEKKAAFKAKGEEVAVNVRKMIESGKVTTKSILDLIRAWLRMVPGINKFFLEQEAKIKTDNIVEYAEANRGSSGNDL